MYPKESGVFKDFIKFGTAVVGVYHQPLQGGRISSSLISSTLLSSAPQPPAGGYVGGGGQGLAGWSEARPTPGYSNIPSPQSNVGLFYGSTSGIMPHSSLSPSYQSSVGQSEGLSMYQHQLLSPAPLGGRPAYCYHCLQFGSVYTINPAQKTFASHNCDKLILSLFCILFPLIVIFSNPSMIATGKGWPL